MLWRKQNVWGIKKRYQLLDFQGLWASWSSSSNAATFGKGGSYRGPALYKVGTSQKWSCRKTVVGFFFNACLYALTVTLSKCGSSLVVVKLSLFDFFLLILTYQTSRAAAKPNRSSNGSSLARIAVTSGRHSRMVRNSSKVFQSSMSKTM